MIRNRRDLLESTYKRWLVWCPPEAGGGSSGREANKVTPLPECSGTDLEPLPPVEDDLELPPPQDTEFEVALVARPNFYLWETFTSPFMKTVGLFGLAGLLLAWAVSV